MKQLKQLDHYVRAAIPEPYFVALVQLRSFSLGHLLLMRRFGCTFADEDPEAYGNLGDLYLAAAICSRTYESFLEFVRDDAEFNRWCKEWGNKIEKYVKEHMEGDDLDEKVFIYYTECVDMLKKYMRDGITTPAYWESDKDELGGSGAHWSQSILNNLMSELNYTFSEAVNMPVSKAIAENFKLLETKGVLTLKADWEIDSEESQENPTEKEVNG